LPPLRTVKIVVPCQTAGSFWDACMNFPSFPSDLGVGEEGYNRGFSRRFRAKWGTGSREENASG
jgi:hypothetical protein